MKKIIATAVAAAFVAPVYAADITISGDQEFAWESNNGATTASLDGDFNIKASTETANGLSVSADININEDAGNDGGASLTIGGPFGKLDLGDTSSAVDAVDDATDWGLSQTQGSPNNDASVLWTLPSIAPGLSLYVSTSADGNDGAAQDGGDVNPGGADDTADDAHTGFAVKYKNSGLTIGYGQNDYDFGNDTQVVSLAYAAGGLSVAAETHTATTEAGVETDTETLGVTYSMGDLMVGVETLEDGTQDLTVLGAHYGLGGGVTAFIESLEDDNDDTAETVAVGVTMKF